MKLITTLMVAALFLAVVAALTDTRVDEGFTNEFEVEVYRND